jgi:hypothetical protein
MRNKWVELVTRRGALACAEMTYSRNNSPSNFKAMCRARVAYEAAVEAIGKDVVAKSQKRCRHSARPATTQTAPPSKDVIPRPVLTEAGAYPFALARLV